MEEQEMRFDKKTKYAYKSLFKRYYLKVILKYVYACYM